MKNWPKRFPPYEGEKAASLVRRPEDSHTYVIYHEAQGCTFTERETNGGFVYPEDLMAVKGIGKKKMEAIRPLLLIETYESED